jgi:hypothetical protein
MSISTKPKPVSDLEKKRGWFHNLSLKGKSRRTVILVLLATVTAIAGILFASLRPGLLGGDQAFATQVAKAVIAACPMSDPADAKAREACGEKMVSSEFLTNSLSSPVIWGLQKKAGNFEYVKDNRTTTKLNPMVVRRVYLSLFMFTGDYKIEKLEDRTIIHLPFKYRNKLDVGEYPYPYWHSKAKWEAFQFSPEMLFVVQDSKVMAMIRAVERDRSREFVSHEWDGKWHWTSKNGQEEPRVTLFEYLFSKSNPHIAELDTTYRAFDAESRKLNCASCHNPSNPSKMAPLGIMEFPNQTLTLRHRIVKVMEANRMPPAAVIGTGPNAKFVSPGIENEAERQKYLQLARAFEQAGDKALAYEKQPID